MKVVLSVVEERMVVDQFVWLASPRTMCRNFA
jgi:hypothetical protein